MRWRTNGSLRRDKDSFRLDQKNSMPPAFLVSNPLMLTRDMTFPPKQNPVCLPVTACAPIAMISLNAEAAGRFLNEPWSLLHETYFFGGFPEKNLFTRSIHFLICSTDPSFGASWLTALS